MAAPSPEAPVRRKAAISFTGGKDSMTVLHMMRAPEVLLEASAGLPSEAWRTDVRDRLAQVAGCEVSLLVTFVPAGAKQSFKAHPLEVVKLQARALGLPHVVMEVSPQPSFMDSYRDNITRLREEHGIQVLATGDILDVCSSFMPRAAAGTGVQLLSPLWGIERGLLLEAIWAYDMAPVITCVNTTKFGTTAVTATGAEAKGTGGGTVEGGGSTSATDGDAAVQEGSNAASDLDGTVASGAACEACTSAAASTGGTQELCAVPSSSEAATTAVVSPVTVGADGWIAGDNKGAPARGSGSCSDSGGGGCDGGRTLLGRVLDRGLHKEVLLPAVQSYGVDECGEWGEYHTMVVRSRLFAAPLRLLSYEVRQEGEYAFLAVQGAQLGLEPAHSPSS